MRSRIIVGVGILAGVALGATWLGVVGLGQERAPTAATAEEITVPSPMSGLFALADMSGGPPAVKVGDHVRGGTVLGMVDNMPVRAMVSGTVTEIMVQDGQMVTSGQALFRMRTP